MIKEGIKKLAEGLDLTYVEAREIMKEVMTGKATEAQLGAFLTALRMKGETVEEVTAFASVMREFCYKISPKVDGRLVDTCGTGGDKIKTFNVSTASAFVISGAGIPVAKHGNRSVTSRCGSADVLERLGFNLDLEPKAVERMIERVGIGFMFAPRFHPAMRYAVKPRRELGIRTVFNVLGPLTNPANVDAQVLGVYSGKWLKPVAYVLKNLGCKEAMVVYGLDGVDELSVTGKTLVAWLKDGEVAMMEVAPEKFGFRKAEPEEVRGLNPVESSDLIFKLLNDRLSPRDPRRSMVLLNAAAGIVVGGKAESLAEGIEVAAESIESGAAYRRLRDMVKASRGDLARLEELEAKYA